MIRCLLFFAFLVPAWGQAWNSLSELRPGDSLRVVDSAGKEHRGAFSAASADSLTIQTRHGADSIEKAKVRQVLVRSSSRRIRNLLIGVGVGVATGIAIDQTLGTALRNETGDSKRPLMYLAPIGLFGAIGGAVPAYRTIYRVR